MICGSQGVPLVENCVLQCEVNRSASGMLAVISCGSAVPNTAARLHGWLPKAVSRTAAQLYDLSEIAKPSTTTEQPFDDQAREGIEPGTSR